MKTRKDAFQQPKKSELSAVASYYSVYVQNLRHGPARVSTIFGIMSALLSIANIISMQHSDDPSFLIAAFIVAGITAFCLIHTFTCGLKYRPFVKGDFELMYGFVEDKDKDEFNDTYCFVRFVTQGGHTLRTWFHVPDEGVAIGSPLMLVRTAPLDGSKSIYRILTPAMLRPYAPKRRKYR